VPLFEKIGHYINQCRRKRPTPTGSAAGAARGLAAWKDPRQAQPRRLIEFLHTATLLAHDVVDMSDQPVVAASTGHVPVRAMLLACWFGDFLYSRASK